MPIPARKSEFRPEITEIVRELFETCGNDLEEVLTNFAGASELSGRYAEEANLTLAVSLRQLLSRAENYITEKRFEGDEDAHADNLGVGA